MTELPEEIESAFAMLEGCTEWSGFRVCEEAGKVLRAYIEEQALTAKGMVAAAEQRADMRRLTATDEAMDYCSANAKAAGWHKDTVREVIWAIRTRVAKSLSDRPKEHA